MVAKTRCIPCVEKRLRKLVKQRTEELRQAQAENAKLKEAMLCVIERAEIGSIVRVPYDAWKKGVSLAAPTLEDK